MRLLGRPESLDFQGFGVGGVSSQGGPHLWVLGFTQFFSWLRLCEERAQTTEGRFQLAQRAEKLFDVVIIPLREKRWAVRKNSLDRRKDPKAWENATGWACFFKPGIAEIDIDFAPPKELVVYLCKRLSAYLAVRTKRGFKVFVQYCGEKQNLRLGNIEFRFTPEQVFILPWSAHPEGAIYTPIWWWEDFFPFWESGKFFKVEWIPWLAKFLLKEGEQ